jgi:hypothetical protein
MNANSSAILVPPPAPAAMTNDLRAIKPPVEIPNDWAWVWWTLGAAVFIALVVIAYVWWRKKRAQVPPIPVIPPHIRAKQKLHAALALIHDPRLFCTEVSGIARVYLEERFNFHAPERTTEEFLLELKATTLLTLDQKQSLGEFLQSCDLVKFARFEPTEAALRALHDSALRMVDETQFDPITNSAAPGLHGPPPVPPPLPPAPPPIPPHASAPAPESEPRSVETIP